MVQSSCTFNIVTSFNVEILGVGLYSSFNSNLIMHRQLQREIPKLSSLLKFVSCFSNEIRHSNIEYSFGLTNTSLENLE